MKKKYIILTITIILLTITGFLAFNYVQNLQAVANPSNVQIEILGQAISSGQVDYSIETIPSGANLLFGYEFENDFGTTPYPRGGNFAGLSGNLDAKIFRVFKSGYRTTDFGLGEENKGKKIRVLITLLPIEACVNSLTYDSSVHQDLVQVSDCVVWIFIEGCGTEGKWYVYRPDNPEVSNIIMTQEEYESLVPSECLEIPEPTDPEPKGFLAYLNAIWGWLKSLWDWVTFWN